MTATTASMPTGEDLLAPVASELEAAVATFMKENGLPGGSAGIVVDQELAWAANLGFADMDAGRAPDERTLYRIASITKTFTATAIVQLRDEGRLALDDPLVRHVPEFAAATNPFGPIEQVTLLRLLRHSSGLQGDPPNDDPRRWTLMTSDRLLAALDRVAVKIPPDSAHKYSNLGYRLLGEVIERVSGLPYGDYVRASILEPLGMTSTVLDPDGSLAERCAVGYDARSFEDRLSPARSFSSGQTVAEGGLWSCVEDLARWVAQQFRVDDALERGPGQVLQGSSVAEMHRAVVVDGAEWKQARGLGWGAHRRDEKIVVSHGGLLNGFCSRVSFDPADRLGVVILFNGVSRHDIGDLRWSLLELCRTPIRGARERTAIPAQPPSLAPTLWRELLGRYVDASFGEDARVEARDGRLVWIEEPDGRTLGLTSTDDPLVFRVTEDREAGEDVRFLRDHDGRIDAVSFAGYPYVRLIPLAAEVSSTESGPA
jgi:D-alanyl-D-alanine carboxypeptidase